ncbi:MAG: hypothetical protein ACJ72Q_18815 [Nitrososphaeraceae archaeon]
MRCFNCYSEFAPTLSKPLCQECGFCYYCRDFFSCIHYDADSKDQNKKQKQQEEQQQLSQSPWENKKKNDIQNWDSYTELISSATLTTTPPDPENSTAVLVIDESLRRKLGKLHILELIQKLTSPEMNCYVDIIPTGTSDNEVIKVFNSYVNIPALIVTSDKGLYERLPAKSLFIKAKKGSNAVRVITQAIRHRISRL